jgi:hypothetical protein
VATTIKIFDECLPTQKSEIGPKQFQNGKWLITYGG